MGLTEEERQRIKEEEKARLQARREEERVRKAEENRKTAMGCAVLLGLGALVFLYFSLTSRPGQNRQPAVSPTPRYTLQEATQKQEQTLLKHGIDARVVVKGTPPSRLVYIYGPWTRVLAYRAVESATSLDPWIRLGTWSELGVRKVILVGPTGTWECELKGGNWAC